MGVEPAKPALDIGLIVSNIDACLDFYVGFLGLEMQGEIDVPFGHMHRLRFGESIVKLTVPRVPASPGARELTAALGMRYLTFPVSNIHELADSVLARGLPQELELQELLPGLLVMMLRDPDGNIVELIQRL